MVDMDFEHPFGVCVFFRRDLAFGGVSFCLRIPWVFFWRYLPFGGVFFFFGDRSRL